MKVLCVFLVCFLTVVCSERTIIAKNGGQPHTYTLLGKPNSDDEIHFKVLLKQNNKDVLDRTFWEVSDPKHPRYGQFLRREEVDSLVAPNKESVQRVKDWLNQEGVSTNQMTAFSDYVSVRVPVSHAEKIFNSEFFNFESKKGKRITRIIGEASVPNEIIPHIDFIGGLSEFLADFHHTPVPFNLAMGVKDDPIITPSVLFDFYNIVLNATNETNIQGIAAFSDYYSAGALTNFWSSFNIPQAQVTNYGTNCLSQGCDQTESDLDMQYMTAIGQGIPTVFINQDPGGWVLDWAQQIEAMTNPPLVNSISYGLGEAYQCSQVDDCQTLGYDAQQYIERTDTELAKLGTLGLTVMVSSGDDGAPGQSYFSTGNCPIDATKYCPAGGCEHTTSQCAGLTITDTSKKVQCFYPMGNQNSACNTVLSNKNVNTALQNFVNGQTGCTVDLDEDSQGNDNIYSSCTCSQLKGVATGTISISGYTFSQNNGAVFSAEYPSTSPYVTAVGATKLLDTNVEIAASIDDGSFITTGGGFSVYTPMPDFQKAAVSSYLNSGTALPPSFSYNPSNRAIPDISLNGHQYEVAVSTNSKNYNTCPCQATGVDGTSCSSPAFAGFVSLLNNNLLNAGYGPIGPINQLLYQMAVEQPDAYNTISQGNNKCTKNYCCTYGFVNSKSGWNPVTGLGTPDYTKLQNYIMQAKYSALNAAPSSSVSVVLLGLVSIIVLIFA
eukprot:TRINITY_DN270_c0_g1_i1.p1 TRINITY_DN270_c0_g1~~TRINITY_DN270_c0_g1_i1.p1  ORF type:complete len:720 (-),score=161.11 TRINITY_DN270_c0_g1_i1:78-2237(-)